MFILITKVEILLQNLILKKNVSCNVTVEAEF
jgi:hypothetical protein